MARLIIRRGEVQLLIQPTPRNMVGPVVRPYNTTFSTLEIGDVFVAAENLQLGAYRRCYKASISAAILVFSLDFCSRYGAQPSMLEFGWSDPVVALPDKYADTDQSFADICSGDSFFIFPPSRDDRRLMRKWSNTSFAVAGGGPLDLPTLCPEDQLVYLR